MYPIINDTIQFLLYPEWNTELIVIKVIFILFGLYFLGFIIWALRKTTWLGRILLWDLKEILSYQPYGMKKLDKEWKEIENRMDRGLESDAKLALIEADSLFNESLKRMGYPGESLGERLDHLTVDLLPNLDEVLKVHQVRNDIIHDPTYKLNIKEAKAALEVFQKALFHVGAL